MAEGLGTDFFCVSDLDANFTLVTDEKTALAQSTARRLQTPLGGILDDINYGEDVSNEIGRSRSVLALQQRVEIETLKDERVEDTITVITRKEPGDPGVGDDEIGDTLIEIRIFPSEDEPFDLTLDVSAGELTLTILEEGT